MKLKYILLLFLFFCSCVSYSADSLFKKIVEDTAHIIGKNIFFDTASQTLFYSKFSISDIDKGQFCSFQIKSRIERTLFDFRSSESIEVIRCKKFVLSFYSKEGDKVAIRTLDLKNKTISTLIDLSSLSNEIINAEFCKFFFSKNKYGMIVVKDQKILYYDDLQDQNHFYSTSLLNTDVLSVAYDQRKEQFYILSSIDGGTKQKHTSISIITINPKTKKVFKDVPFYLLQENNEIKNAGLLIENSNSILVWVSESNHISRLFRYSLRTKQEHHLRLYADMLDLTKYNQTDYFLNLPIIRAGIMTLI